MCEWLKEVFYMVVNAHNKITADCFEIIIFLGSFIIKNISEIVISIVTGIVTGLIIFHREQKFLEDVIKPKDKLKEINVNLSSCIKIFEVLKEKISENKKTERKTVPQSYTFNWTLDAQLEFIEKQLNNKEKCEYTNSDNLNNNIKDALNKLRNIAFNIAGLYEVYPKAFNRYYTSFKLTKKDIDKIIDNLLIYCFNFYFFFDVINLILLYKN